MKYESIRGMLAGAAVGEALGSVTATWTTEMILAEYGGYNTELRKAPVSTKMKGLYPAGHSADAVSHAMMLLQRFTENGGAMTEYDAGEVLLQWAQDPDNLALAGSVTKEGYGHLANIDTGYRYPFLTFDHHKISNEGAARAFAVAAFYPGQPEIACEKAVMVYKNIYDNMISLAGVGAMAYALSTALQDGTTVNDVLAAAAQGARRGFEIADSYRIQPAATALVDRRMELAIEVGSRHRDDFDGAMKALEELIGNSNASNESVPVVFGCLAACGDDASSLIKMAVNIGNDTDMIGAMAGAIAGAMHPEILREEDVALVERVNGYDFDKTAKDILSIVG